MALQSKRPAAHRGLQHDWMQQGPARRVRQGSRGRWRASLLPDCLPDNAGAVLCKQACPVQLQNMSGSLKGCFNETLLTPASGHQGHQEEAKGAHPKLQHEFNRVLYLCPSRRAGQPLQQKRSADSINSTALRISSTFSICSTCSLHHAVALKIAHRTPKVCNRRIEFRITFNDGALRDQVHHNRQPEAAVGGDGACRIR